MKRFKAFFLFLCAGILFSNCEDEDVKSKNRIQVSDYNSIQIGGNAIVEIQTGAPGAKTVVIEGNTALISEFKIEAVNGVLHINASENVSKSDNIHVIVPVLTLTRIVLEANQEAEVVWEEADQNTIFEQLDIKTEANSMLSLLGLKIRNVNIQQEAESKVFLNSASPTTPGEVKIEVEDVTFLNDTTAVLHNETLLYYETSDIVTEGDVEYYILAGENLRSFFIIENLHVTLQAVSEMLADEAPVNYCDIKLEGESTAHIYAIKSLSGKGEGASVLYYYGNPAIDYLTQANAQIVKILPDDQ